VSAPSLVDLVAGVEADLNANGYLPEVRLGKDVPAQEGDPVEGRVVFWPKAVTLIPTARRVGGNPRQMAVWKQDLDIHIWKRAATQVDASTQFGADYDAAMVLTHAVIASLVREWTYGSLDLGQAIPQDETRTLVFGVEFILRATVWIPVRDVAWPTVEAASESVDKMRFPSGDHVARPSA
jgi:hypothetical protein